jgi:two-component system phosphate regulon sensor histidine kinase PhoR
MQAPRSAQQHVAVLVSVIEEVDRMTRLADHPLQLAREDAAEAPPARQPMRLDQAAREVGERARAIAEREHVTIVIESAPPVTIWANPQRLRQVFDNVLENAVKYNRPGGSVVVRGWQAGEKALIEIADTGVGIPPQALPRIFDRFFRVDESRNSRRGGSGLGLSIAQAAAKSLGGELIARSELGVGSAFRLELPIGE